MSRQAGQVSGLLPQRQQLGHPPPEAPCRLQIRFLPLHSRSMVIRSRIAAARSAYCTDISSSVIGKPPVPGSPGRATAPGAPAPAGRRHTCAPLQHQYSSFIIISRPQSVQRTTRQAEQFFCSTRSLPKSIAEKRKNLLTNALCSGKINIAVGTAGVAQLVEQLICNQQVGGSNPSTSSKISYGGIPERPNGADCKSVVTDFGGSNPPSPTNKRRHLSAFIFFVLNQWRLRPPAAVMQAVRQKRRTTPCLRGCSMCQIS